jgi:hypothetical protein
MKAVGAGNVLAVTLVIALAAWVVAGTPASLFVLAVGVAVAVNPRLGSARSGLGLRLAGTVVLAAVALFVLNGFLAIAFGFQCEGDTAYLVAGTDKADYCRLLHDHGVLRLLMVFGPSLLALAVGLAGARKRDSRHVLVATVCGLALTIAAHVSDFVLLG